METNRLDSLAAHPELESEAAQGTRRRMRRGSTAGGDVAGSEVYTLLGMVTCGLVASGAVLSAELCAEPGVCAAEY